MGLEIVAAPEQSEKVWATVDDAISRGSYCDFQLQNQLRSYFSAVAEGKEADLSAIVLEDDKLAGYVLANRLNGMTGYFGRPLHFAIDPANRRADAAAKALFDHYYRICEQANCVLEFVVDQSPGGALPGIVREALGRGATLVPQYRAVIDLTIGPDEIRRDIRKSYRSLINWGRKTLETTVVGKGDASEETFKKFRAFHAQVAGRVTRPRASWDAMRDATNAGRAELILGHIDAKLVSATFLNFNKDYTSYSTGVYERAEFDKPIGHWPVFLAILNSCDRGCSRFDLGEVYTGEGVDTKEADIGFFKKGFTDRIQFQAIYRIKP